MTVRTEHSMSFKMEYYSKKLSMTDEAALRTLYTWYTERTNYSVGDGKMDWILQRRHLEHFLGAINTKHYAEPYQANSKLIAEEGRLHRLVVQKPKPQSETALKKDDRYVLGGERMSLILCDTSREGSEHDIQRVKHFCIQNGFSCYMTIQLNEAELFEDLKKFRDGLDENVCCLAIFIMAHGELGHIHVRKGQIELHRIFEMFNNRWCAALRGKPKLFVIQACRGVAKSAQNPSCDGSEVSGSPQECLWPVESDFLFVYAVCPGNLAARYPDTGSPLLEEMNSVFSHSADSMSMFDLFTMVNDRLLKRKERAGIKMDRQKLGLQGLERGRREPKPSVPSSVGGPLHIVDSLTKKWYL